MADLHTLLVEDTLDDAELIRIRLNRVGGFCVCHATSLSEAESVLNVEMDIRVVILDLNLPDSRGIETFTKLRLLRPDLPVVILSGRDDDDIAIEAVKLGAQDYVPKSDVETDGRLLVRSLRYAIERHARLNAERYSRALQRDLEVAQEIQNRLLPNHAPVIDGFQIAFACRPAAMCAGDFLDFIDVGHGQRDLLVADVCGHGFGPSLITVGTRRVIRSFAPREEEIGSILNLANHAVHEDSLDGQFVTLFYARIDPRTGQIPYCSAGHPGWVIRGNGDIETLDYDGFVLGLEPDTLYRTDGVVILEPGDLLVMMTDGVWEAGADNDKIFGLDRVLEFLRDRRDQAAPPLLDELFAEITTHCEPQGPGDDMTAVLVKRI